MVLIDIGWVSTQWTQWFVTISTHAAWRAIGIDRVVGEERADFQRFATTGGCRQIGVIQ